jgi:chemotaxis signal transduction protein
VSGAPAARRLAFRVGATRAAVPLAVVREVVQDAAIIAVPGSHPHVAGVALHRGLALPVYDLARFPPLWSAEAGRRFAAGGVPRAPLLIVCAWGEAMVGLLGDEVDLLEGEAYELDADAATALSPVFLTGQVKGTAAGAADRIACLDVQKLFPSLGVPDEALRPAREDAGEDDPAGR